MATLRNQLCLVMFLACATLVSICGCKKDAESNTHAGKPILRLGTTTTTRDSGLLEILLPVFESKHAVKVEVQAVGTGKALDLGRAGEVDVVMVHARKQEDEFINEGYGINRHDVMYNEFVLLGPPEDPLEIREEEEAVAALAKIAGQSTKFVSRGDKSGTHTRELQIWGLAAVKPVGSWYIETDAGMLNTMRRASDEAAYVLADRSTFLFNQESLNLVVVLEGDERLFNPYGIIAVNPEKHPDVNYKAAMQFIEFITSVAGQELLATHGALRFGKPLFTPMAYRPE